MIKKRLRNILPPWLRVIRRNCGGYNRNTSLFAGHLSDGGSDEALWAGRLNALIFPNGVRKSTMSHRNTEIVNGLLNRGELQWNKEFITVLDMGASAGLDALGTLSALEKHIRVSRYVLGDRYTELLFDTRHNRVFDQDGAVIQQLQNNRFVNLYFEFKYSIEPLFHPWNILRTRHLRKRLTGVQPDPGHTIRIPLIHPTAAAHPLMTGCRADVFQPLTEKYDLIICMNLLQKRYFTEEQVALGIQNLKEGLAPGGFLLTGVTDDWQLLSHNQTG